MKTLFTLFAFCLFSSASSLLAQQNPDDCQDIVYLRGGSEYRGKITEYAPGGNLVIVTWNGVTMTVPADNVKRVVQRCKESRRRQPRDYDFKERGLYNATRLGVLVGQTYVGEKATGASLYHSIGWMFNRWIGAGIGGGVETFSPDGFEAPSYPIFVEARGYFLEKNVTPFYTIGAGWAFTGKNAGSQWGYTDNWSGGWLAKMQIGYRLGNHFTMHGGLSFQKKTRDWRSTWGGEWGKDRILHKRLELGIGVIL